jgi:hypothetical protein
MEDVGIFYGKLVNVVVIWYIFPVLVCFTEKNLATLSVVKTRQPRFLMYIVTSAQPKGLEVLSQLTFQYIYKNFLTEFPT